MKNTQLFSCLLFTTIASHCMEEPNPWKTIDCSPITKTLNNNYLSYAKKRLEEYKITDLEIPKDMWHLCNMNNYITGRQHPDFPYNDIRDKEGNSFMRVAVKKMDLPFVDWHVKGQGAQCITQEDIDFCVDACIRQMLPTVEETTKNTAYNILKTITLKQGVNNYYIYKFNQKSSREALIKQLISLQIKHKKHESNFAREESLITNLLTTANDDPSPILLSDMYQMITDEETGDTLSHIVVDLHNADELCQLINKNYVSPLKNKNEMTIADLALSKFQLYIRQGLMDLCKEEASRARCCLFMLLRYITAQQTGTLSDEFKCCDTHVITMENI